MLRTFLAFLLAATASPADWVQEEGALPPLSPAPPGASSPQQPWRSFQPHRWEVVLSNADDQVYVECNKEVLTPAANFSQSVRIDLTPCLRPHFRNDIYIRLRNEGGAVTWGWQFLDNGQPALTMSGKPAKGGCGVVGKTGCNNNSPYPKGIVQSAHYWFDY
ncbi:hypothetical protein [Sphingomonas sp.]|jgi:hypothetical protein|uniref:hypothetical protein n=1 Tax=Sphingomonas sp. TaxID=28214 RepID=UPI002E380086|nr:hypothetical protein [Sphingomonas sp.]HEX4693560.1 hypothetical protein [Sphingomonas sp.]